MKEKLRNVTDTKKIDKLGFWVVLGPLSDELVEMMWSKNWPVSREVVKVVHDDRHEQVDNLHICDIVHRLLLSHSKVLNSHHTDLIITMVQSALSQIAYGEV